ncbi:MAG: hypothetical protein HGA78_10185 [Nitrospirales bacterium]|nr:hypothetical protein [Nitrospirales bacterium]
MAKEKQQERRPALPTAVSRMSAYRPFCPALFAFASSIAAGRREMAMIAMMTRVKFFFTTGSCYY